MAKYSIEELEGKLTSLKDAKDEGAVLLRTLIESELKRRSSSGRPKVSLLNRAEQNRLAVQKYRSKDKF